MMKRVRGSDVGVVLLFLCGVAACCGEEGGPVVSGRLVCQMGCGEAFEVARDNRVIVCKGGERGPLVCLSIWRT